MHKRVRCKKCGWIEVDPKRWKFDPRRNGYICTDCYKDKRKKRVLNEAGVDRVYEDGDVFRPDRDNEVDTDLIYTVDRSNGFDYAMFVVIVILSVCLFILSIVR